MFEKINQVSDSFIQRVTIVVMTVGDSCLVTVVIVACRDSDPEEQGVGEARDVDDDCG